MYDNYFHDDIDIIYVTENIPGPAEDTLEYEILMSNFNTVLLHNCVCIKSCVKIVCHCLQLSRGDNYDRYILDGDLRFKLRNKLNMFWDYPVMECNSNCSCSSSCGNRVVQNGPTEGLIVKKCDDEKKGLGLFAGEYIYRGTFICEYAGELLTRTQALVRNEENEAQGKMNYIFCLNEYTYSEGLVQTFVDPSKFGNIGRYINHSCEPNAYIVPVRSEISIPHLAIFAYTDIFPGEEITFSYGCEVESGFDVRAVRQQKICLCKSKDCKGLMPSENF